MQFMMDYHNFDSQIIENLNFLRPPVTRNCIKTDYTFRKDKIVGFIGGDSNNVDTVRDYTQTCTTKSGKTTKRALQSSLSLILQQTSQKQIIEKYSFLNFEAQHCQKNNFINFNKTEETSSARKNKPLIKVTVIPKPGQKPVIKLLKTNKKLIRTIKSTFSNQDNSTQSQNVYLVVAGSKKEKIYEIKTTGSVQLTKETFDNRDVKLYEALKMEKKKKKVTTKERNLTKDRGKDIEIEIPRENVCKCFKPKEVELREIKAGTSRVKIFGRIGLTENDKYVLKCVATVNDQPAVPTNFTGEEINFSSNFLRNFKPSSIIEKYDKGTTMQPEDVSVHPETQNYHLNQIPDVGHNIFRNQRYNEWITMRADPPKDFNGQSSDRKSFRTESQGTQINTKSKLNSKRTNDLMVQCECTDLWGSESSSPDKPFELKASASPLVIITVYPKRDIVSPITITKRKQSPNSLFAECERPFEDSENGDIKMNKKVLNNPQSLRRSVSPTKMPPKPKVQHRKQFVSQTRLVKTNNNLFTSNQSPTRPKTTANVNNKTQPKDVSNNSNRGIRFDVEKQRTKSPRSPRNKILNTNKVQTKDMSTETCNRKTLKQKKSIIVQNKHTMNEHVLVKKLPKEIRKSFPKHDVSKVSVSIDSECEFYDVVFEQGRYTTDLTVRKTAKEFGSQKYFEGKQKSDSLENFSPGEVNETSARQRRSISHSLAKNTIDVALAEPTSRINVRDSLELRHRREEKDIKNTQTKRLFNSHSAQDNDADFLAPIKHYTGDNCVICDPVERDKEIRELLGIQKHRKHKKQTDTTQQVDDCRIQDSNSCSFNVKSCKSLLKATMVKSSCMCTTCFKETAMMHDLYISSSRDEMVHSSTDVNKQVTDLTNNVVLFEIDKQHNVKIKSTQETLCENTTKEIPTLFGDLSLYYRKQKSIHLSRKQYGKVKMSMRKILDRRQKKKPPRNSSKFSIENIRVKPKHDLLKLRNSEVLTDPILVEFAKPSEAVQLNIKDHNEQTTVLFARDGSVGILKNKKENDNPKKISSSVELRYSSAIFARELEWSFTNIGSLGSSSAERKKHQSIETLFRGHKKSRTPNLGTSAISLLSEANAQLVSKTESESPSVMKPKKPFLRRLMSCLVIRSGRVSEAKLVPGVKCQPPTLNSSFDSYHISTSLGAIEMSSSLYDTSASFYSNHTIGPLHSKMKRSFFSSVRGFLTSRKS